MKIEVFEAGKDGQSQKRICGAELQSLSPDSMVVTGECSIPVDAGASIELRMVLASPTGNLTLLATSGDVHVLTVMCSAASIAPFVGFLAPDGRMIEIYFELKAA